MGGHHHHITVTVNTIICTIIYIHLHHLSSCSRGPSTVQDLQRVNSLPAVQAFCSADGRISNQLQISMLSWSLYASRGNLTLGLS